MNDTCKRIGFFVLGAALATVTVAAAHAAGQPGGAGPASFIAQQGGPGPDGGGIATAAIRTGYGARTRCPTGDV